MFSKINNDINSKHILQVKRSVYRVEEEKSKSNKSLIPSL